MEECSQISTRKPKLISYKAAFPCSELEDSLTRTNESPESSGCDNEIMGVLIIILGVFELLVVIIIVTGNILRYYIAKSQPNPKPEILRIDANICLNQHHGRGYDETD
jgi:hypothetical protein